MQSAVRPGWVSRRRRPTLPCAVALRLPLSSPAAEGREAGFRGACAEPPSALRAASRKAPVALRANGPLVDNLFIETGGSDS